MKQYSVTDLKEENGFLNTNTYIFLGTGKYGGVSGYVDMTGENVRAHVSDHEFLVFSCLRLQTLREARKFDPVNGLIVAVATSCASQHYSS